MIVSGYMALLLDLFQPANHYPKIILLCLTTKPVK